MTVLLLLLAAAAAFCGVVALGLLQTALAGACFVAASVMLVGSTLVHHLVMIDRRLLAIRSRLDDAASSDPAPAEDHGGPSVTSRLPPPEPAVGDRWTNWSTGVESQWDGEKWSPV